nr:hypothetical protein [Acidithiobacillus ferrooxidans]
MAGLIAVVIIAAVTNCWD